MSEEDFRIKQIKIGQQNADFSEVEQPEEKRIDLSQIQLFEDNTPTEQVFFPWNLFESAKKPQETLFLQGDFLLPEPVKTPYFSALKTPGKRTDKQPLYLFKADSSHYDYSDLTMIALSPELAKVLGNKRDGKVFVPSYKVKTSASGIEEISPCGLIQITFTSNPENVLGDKSGNTIYLPGFKSFTSQKGLEKERPLGFININLSSDSVSGDKSGNTVYVPGFNITASLQESLTLRDMDAYFQLAHRKELDGNFMQVNTFRPIYSVANAANQVMTHGFLSVKSAAAEAADSKQKQIIDISNTFGKTLDDMGYISMFQQVMIEAFGGTSISDVDEAINKEFTGAVKLKNATQDIHKFNSLVEFMEKYKSLTLVDFKAENVYKLKSAQTAFQLASCAKLFKKASDELKEEQELKDWQKEYCMLGTLEDIDKYKHDLLYQAHLMSRLSPLEKALMKKFNNNKQLCIEWIKAKSKQHNIIGKASGNDYKILVQDFIKESEDFSAAVFKDKDYDSIVGEYSAALRNVVGHSIAEDKLNDFIENQATAKNIMNMAVLIGVSMLTGGSALAAAGAFAAMSTIEESSDADGLTSSDIGNITRDTALTYASFKLFAAVANKATPEAYKALCTQFNVSPDKAIIIAKAAGSVSGGFAAGSTMRFGVGVVSGEDISTAFKEALKTGAYGGAIALGFSLAGDAIGAVKGKISEAKYAKMSPQEQAKYDYENLLKTFKHTQKDNPEYQALMQSIKGDEFSAESVDKVLTFMRKLYDGVHFSPKDIDIIQMKETSLGATKPTEIITQGTPDIVADSGSVSTQRAFMYKYTSPDCTGGTLLSIEEQATLGAIFRFRNSVIRFIEAQSKPLINIENPALTHTPQNYPLTPAGETNPVVSGFKKVCPDLSPTTSVPPVDIPTTAAAKAVTGAIAGIAKPPVAPIVENHTPPELDTKGSKIRDALARTINAGTQFATTIAPYLSVYGAQLPAIPSAVASLLAEASAESVASAPLVLGAASPKKTTSSDKPKTTRSRASKGSKKAKAAPTADKAADTPTTPIKTDGTTPSTPTSLRTQFSRLSASSIKIPSSLKRSLSAIARLSKKKVFSHFLKGSQSVPQGVDELKAKISEIIIKHCGTKELAGSLLIKDLDYALSDHTSDKDSDNLWFLSNNIDILKLDYLYAQAVAATTPNVNIKKLLYRIQDNSDMARHIVSFVEQHPDIPLWAIRNIIEANNDMESIRTLDFNLMLAEKYISQATTPKTHISSWTEEEVLEFGIPQFSSSRTYTDEDYKIFDSTDDINAALLLAKDIAGLNQDLYGLSQEQWKKIANIFQKTNPSHSEKEYLFRLIKDNLDNVDLCIALYEAYSPQGEENCYELNSAISKTLRCPELAAMEVDIMRTLSELNEQNPSRMPEKIKRDLLEVALPERNSTIGNVCENIFDFTPYRLERMELDGFLDIQHGKRGYYMIPSGLLFDISILSADGKALFKKLMKESDLGIYDAYRRAEHVSYKLRDVPISLSDDDTPVASYIKDKYTTLVHIPGRHQQLSFDDIFGYENLVQEIDEQMWATIKKRGILTLEEFESAGRSTSIKDIVTFAKLSNTDFEKLRPLFAIPGRKDSIHFDIPEIKDMFLELSVKEIQTARELGFIEELGDKQLSPKQIHAIAKASPKVREAIIENILPLIAQNSKVSLDDNAISNIAQLTPTEISYLKTVMEELDFILWDAIPDAATLKNAIKLFHFKEKYPDMSIFKKIPLRALTINHNGCEKAVKIFEKLDPEKNPLFMKYPNIFIKSEADVESIIKISSLTRKDGSPIIKDRYDLDSVLREAKHLEKIIGILNCCEDTSVPIHTICEVASNEERFKMFITTRDTILEDGKPAGGDLALTIAAKMKVTSKKTEEIAVEDDSPELTIDHPNIRILINAKNRNGEPLFTRKNIANILENATGDFEKQLGLNLPEFMIGQLKNIENRILIDFACQNANLVYAYGMEVISHMAKYAYMNDSTTLKRFLDTQAQAVGMKNQAMLTRLWGGSSASPETIRKALDVFKSLLNESLNYNLFDKINALPVNNALKLKLATNNLTITEEGLDRAIRYFKSLDKSKLAQCSDENVSEMITLKAMEITSQNVSDNLALLGKASDLQEKFSQIEKELFSDELEKISAQVAKALSQVITPAQVEKADMTRFFRSFAFNADAINGQTPDSILSSSGFAQFLQENGKRGIELAFSRKDFIKALNRILRPLDEKTASDIISKIGITFPTRVARLAEVPKVQKPASTFTETPYTSEMLEDYEKAHLASKETSPIDLIFNGEIMSFTKYEGTQGGSNEGYIVKAINGDLFYVKFPSTKDAATQEVLASRLYREAGILTPEISFIKTSEGKVGIASKIIPSTHNITSPDEIIAFQSGFAVDAWLANWDITRNNNAVFSVHDDTCARMDVGGSLEYRARGEKKNSNDFDYKVRALSSLLANNTDNPIVQQISISSLRESMERILSISDETIAALTEQSGCPKTVAETLIARKKYIANIYNQLGNLPQSDFITPDLLLELDKNILYDNGSAFNGILTDLKLDLNNPVERQVHDLVHEFIYENQLQVENPEIKELLTQIIKAFPEYMSIIGKQQHHTHACSLEGHMLSVLNKAVNSPEYADLSKMDKLVLKLAILFHDISKSENLIDHSHPKISSMYARDILKRANLPVATKERIIELIENHHWFKRANSNPTESDMKEIAARFRRNGDLVLAKIFAEADLSSIRPGFERGLIENLPATYKKLQALQKEMHSIGSFTYTTPFIRRIMGDKANVAYERNGHTYNISVLNFSRNAKGKENVGTVITDETDLRDFGFITSNGLPVSKKDISFLAHCTENPMDVFYLGDITANADICTSNITLDNIRFYDGKNACGVILEPVEQANIGSSLDTNQGSGRHKNFVNFSSEIWAYSRKDGHISEKKENAATFRRCAFTDYMEQLGIPLSEEEYGEIHKIFFEQMYLSHIHDIRLSTGRIIKEKELMAAIKYTDEQIRANKHSHNETNVYAPKIRALFATEDSLDKVPLKLLIAAEELGIPIFLLGKQ
ncbi:MAG: HD domain-containing protein [bacterium]|nr:HD domain-containing protein [bacterium]